MGLPSGRGGGVVLGEGIHNKELHKYTYQLILSEMRDALALGLGGKELNYVLSFFSFTITLKTKTWCLILKSNYHK